MEKIDITKRVPTLEDCGKTYLCVVKSCGIFQGYELAEWFNPLEDEDLADREPHEMPHFSIENRYCGQQALDRDVTHWFELPELPYRVG